MFYSKYDGEFIKKYSILIITIFYIEKVREIFPEFSLVNPTCRFALEEDRIMFTFQDGLMAFDAIDFFVNEERFPPQRTDIVHVESLLLQLLTEPKRLSVEAYLWLSPILCHKWNTKLRVAGRRR